MSDANRSRLLQILFVGFCALWCLSASHAAIPQANDPDAYTEKQFRLDLLDYNKRSMSQAYLKVGKRDPKWDDLVVELLDAQAVQYTNGKRFEKAHVPGEITQDRRTEIINQLKSLNCDDPYVAYIILTHSDPKEENFLNLALIACHDLLDSEYPKNRKRSACWYFAESLDKQGREEESAELVQRWIDLVCESVNDQSMALQDQYLMFHAFKNGIKKDWLPRWQAVCERIEGKEVANPWLANAIIGFYHTEAAWTLRIQTHRFTQQHEDWGNYVDHLDIARDHLVNAWESAPQFPVAPYKLIQVSVCQSTGEERLWFDRAIDAQADYYLAYSYYLWSCQPKRGGSRDQMYAFGVECLDTDRFDTRIPDVFYEAMRGLYKVDGGYDYWRKPEAYDNLIRYYEGKKHEPHSKRSEQWWGSMKAAISWRLGKYELAAQHMQQLADDFMPEVFSGFGGEPVLAASEIYVRINPTTDAAADSAEKLWTQKRHRRAAELLDATLLELAPDDPARAYLENKAAQSRWKHRNQQGVWANLLGRNDLGGWDVERGAWSMDNQGRLTGNSLDNGLAAVCRLKFGYRYELKASLECLQAPDPQQANGGVLMAYQVNGSKAYHRDILLFPEEQSILAARTFKYATESYPAELQQKNNFHLQVWDRHVRLTVNDKVVIEHRRMPRKLSRTVYRFALGGYYNEPGATIRYDELKIRRLHQRPDWLDLPTHTPSKTEVSR